MKYLVNLIAIIFSLLVVFPITFLIGSFFAIVVTFIVSIALSIFVVQIIAEINKS